MNYKKYNKNYERWQENGKMSRKFKKELLGKKINKSKLKNMINNTVIILDKENDCCYPPEIKPHGEFCPNCGCIQSRTVDYGAPYPEVWYECFCLRCGESVGGADNSRFSHVLEDMKYED